MRSSDDVVVGDVDVGRLYLDVFGLVFGEIGSWKFCGVFVNEW